MSMRIFEALVRTVFGYPLPSPLRRQGSRFFSGAGGGRSVVPACAGTTVLGVIPLFLLAACNSSHEVPEAPADVDGKLFCAVGGAAEMSQSCLLERVDSPEGQVLVVHHPEGGFRRFRIVRDGRGVVPADGAEPSKLYIVAENMIDVAVAGDRYRFPATIGPKAD